MLNILQQIIKNSLISAKPQHRKIEILIVTVLMLANIGSASVAVPKGKGFESKISAPQKAVTLKSRVSAQVFDIALIGDLGYNLAEERKFQVLLADINTKNVAFAIHDGDFKSGTSPCTDAIFQQRLGWFQKSRSPFIYLPGDNEWTDCHRTGADPLERLAKLRALFFPTTFSLGQSVLSLDRQSAGGQPTSAIYRENVRWVHGGVGFIGLHIIGSNNNLGRTSVADQEYRARNAANLEWLKSSFALAKTSNLAGLMIAIQANPGFERPSTPRTGFSDFLDTLRQEVSQFHKPVVLVHGDTHRFQINKPLVNSNGQLLLNFTRVETFGSPNAHWVKVHVDSGSSNVFTFEPVVVAANR